MVNNNGNGHGRDWFTRSMSSGLIASLAWVLVLAIYCTFRALGIEDPLLGQAFLLLTGAWVGSLTLAQGKKNAKSEEDSQTAKKNTEDLTKRVESNEKRFVERTKEIEDRVTESEDRADKSEDRETEWSKHKDHKEHLGDANE